MQNLYKRIKKVNGESIYNLLYCNWIYEKGFYSKWVSCLQRQINIEITANRYKKDSYRGWLLNVFRCEFKTDLVSEYRPQAQLETITETKQSKAVKR